MVVELDLHCERREHNASATGASTTTENQGDSASAAAAPAAAAAAATKQAPSTEAKPAEAVAAVATSQAAEPATVENKPDENKPEENKPDENKPDENKPAESNPSVESKTAPVDSLNLSTDTLAVPGDAAGNKRPSPRRSPVTISIFVLFPSFLCAACESPFGRTSGRFGLGQCQQAVGRS